MQSATGSKAGHVSGLEARFLAQVGHACAGLTRKEADPLVRALVPAFAERQKLGVQLAGKPFDEVYDLATIQPTAAWQTIYEEVSQEIETLLGTTL